MRKKVALVVSHPIQHFCPQYVSFAQHPGVDFKVFFGSALGLKKYIDPNFKQEISWGNLQLEKFDHIFLNGEIALPSDKNLDAPSLETELEHFSPDVVIVYGYFQKLQRRAYNWAKQRKLCIAYISDGEKRQKRSKLKEAFKYFFLRKYFSSIDFFFTVGDANEAYYRFYGVPGKKLLRMHFPIDVRYYKTCFESKIQLRKNIRQALNIDEHVFVVSVVGKLVPWKNQDHLIDMLAILENEGINAHVIIIGSGEMMNSWQNKVKMLRKNKVHFPGFVKIDELPAYYAASDVYIHPASIEPHSLSISEAIYMGCPVILSDRCGSYGPTDDVREGENGNVYRFGDIGQLALLLRKIMESPALCASYSKKSHSIAVEQQEKSHAGILDQLIKSLN